jgi:hypothetical protein
MPIAARLPLAAAAAGAGTPNDLPDSLIERRESSSI